MSNQAKNEMPKMENKMGMVSRYPLERAIRDTRQICLSNYSGDFSTVMREDSPLAGYPLGSVMPFCLDSKGAMIIYTADIAQHSKNFTANGKATILVRDISKNHMPNNGWRLAIIGDVASVADDEVGRVSEQYFRHFPKAEGYEEAHDFYFYRLTPKIYRVIMGFGKISWVEPAEVLSPSPLSEAEENRIITHMNDDHQEAMIKYLADKRIEVTEGFKKPLMAGVNQYGVTIRYRQHLHFIAFETEAKDFTAVHHTLVAMAKA